MEILNRLNRCYPYAENELERGVQELLGPVNKRLVHQAMDALRDSDARRLGSLMTEAQGFFDRYATPACPEELTSPVLHHVLGYEPLKSHILGGKGVGSQGDGTAQFICPTETDQQAVIQILERDLHLPALRMTITPQQKIRKAVIPAAGFGTRLFPATKATKKELFPVVDRDGIAKPAILIIVEEALEAGIEEVIIVVQKNDLDDFRFLFTEQISIENYNKLSPQSQEYSRRLRRPSGDAAQPGDVRLLWQRGLRQLQREHSPLATGPVEGGERDRCLKVSDSLSEMFDPFHLCGNGERPDDSEKEDTGCGPPRPGFLENQRLIAQRMLNLALLDLLLFFLEGDHGLLVLLCIHMPSWPPSLLDRLVHAVLAVADERSKSEMFRLPSAELALLLFDLHC